MVLAARSWNSGVAEAAMRTEVSLSIEDGMSNTLPDATASATAFSTTPNEDSRISGLSGKRLSLDAHNQLLGQRCSLM